MNVFLIVAYYVLALYLLLLVGRLIIAVLQSYSRSWTPSGPLVVVAEVVFTATDPPLRLLRRYIRPLRLGSVSLDLSYTLLFLIVIVLLVVVGKL
jgi:YggT family protein